MWNMSSSTSHCFVTVWWNLLMVCMRTIREKLRNYLWKSAAILFLNLTHSNGYLEASESLIWCLSSCLNHRLSSQDPLKLIHSFLLGSDLRDFLPFSSFKRDYTALTKKERLHNTIECWFYSADYLVTHTSNLWTLVLWRGNLRRRNGKKDRHGMKVIEL